MNCTKEFIKQEEIENSSSTSLLPLETGALNIIRTNYTEGYYKFTCEEEGNQELNLSKETTVLVNYKYDIVPVLKRNEPCIKKGNYIKFDYGFINRLRSIQKAENKGIYTDLTSKST